MRKGDIVQIKFLDHATGPEAFELMCWGRVQKITNKTVVVESWGYPDPNETPDHNCDCYTIVRSAIIESTVLARG